MCDFGLALNRRWLDLNGNSQQETTFVEVTAWNQQAEVISAYCQKGRPVAVEGRLEQERWESPAGEKRSRLKVVAPARHVPARQRRDGAGGGAAAGVGDGGVER
jgi:single-strand DNA-binding protein